mgnify:CR=1 FL=1
MLPQKLKEYLFPIGIEDLIYKYADFAVSLECNGQINAEKLAGLEEKINKEGTKYFTHTLGAGTVTALSIAALFFGSQLQEIVSYIASQGPQYDSVGLVTTGLKAAGHTLGALHYLAPVGILAGGIHLFRSIYLLGGVINIDWKTNDVIRDFGPKSEKLNN